MSIVISGNGIDMGGNPVSNASQIDGTTINENGANVRTESDSYNKTEVDGKIVGFKNYIINGNFDIWQRGTSSTTSGYCCADRWFVYGTNTIPTTNKVLGNTGYNNAINATGIAGNTDFAFIQCIESINAKTFATSSGVLSFWFYSSTNRPSKIAIKYPDVLDTFTGTTPLILQDVTFLIGWNKYTVAIPANANYAKGMLVSIGGYGMALTSGNVCLAQVQLEEGLVATPFEQRPYGLELSLCQRYYKTLTPTIGQSASATNIQFTMNFGEMRISPSLSLSPGTLKVSDDTSYEKEATPSILNVSLSSNSVRIYLNGWSSLTYPRYHSVMGGLCRVTFSSEL